MTWASLGLDGLITSRGAIYGFFTVTGTHAFFLTRGPILLSAALVSLRRKNRLANFDDFDLSKL